MNELTEFTQRAPTSTCCAKSVDVYLCDLTHVNEGVLSSNVFPLGIGLLGTYLLKSDIGKYLNVELFKYPHDLTAKLEACGPPKIIGFANYSWTFEISFAFAQEVKSRWPETVVVFGGPNYGLTDRELSVFWGKAAGVIDFNIVLEGEVAFYKLVSQLINKKFEISKVKECADEKLTNIHFLDQKGALLKTQIGARVDLNDLPSPYVESDLMEKFFDGKLVPLTHTTRGCPFKCTFCSEGASYYNKVKQRTHKLEDEFNSIAKKASEVGIKDLFLSDANYGMFREDGERVKILSEIKKSTGYPENIYVSTGKNAKERVLNVVSELDGAIQLSASLQTTNPRVLQEIERSNISLEALSESAKEATSKGIQSYSELIVGLPTETLEQHIKSILDVIKSGFDNVRIYQLILLPQTKLNSDSTRITHGFVTKYRPMPRSFGAYKIVSTKRLVTEYEEIVVGTNTMPEKDYESARKLALIVDITHNGNLFFELSQYILELKQEWYLFIEFLFQKVISGNLDKDLENQLENFITLMNSGLFDSINEINEILEQRSFEDIQNLFINELAYSKAQLITKNFKLVNEFIYDSAHEFLERSEVCFSNSILNALKDLSLCQKSNLFDLGLKSCTIQISNCELPLFMKCVGSPIPARQYPQESSEFELRLRHSDHQEKTIKYYLSIYGSHADGLSRVVMRYPMLLSILRKPELVEI